jgi:hypothetical protein
MFLLSKEGFKTTTLILILLQVLPVLGIRNRIRICRFCTFLGLPDPDPDKIEF